MKTKIPLFALTGILLLVALVLAAMVVPAAQAKYVPPEVTIPQIQGTGHTSPYVGQVVTTEGIVTAVVYNGYYVQDAVGDGNDNTSDGMFVFKNGPKPSVGDYVELTDIVEEYIPGGASTGNLSITQMGYPSITILSSGNPLPAPASLTDLPDFSITDGADFFEAREGMLVSVENAPVVGPTNNFGEFVVLAKDDAKPGSGFYPQAQQIFLVDLGNEMVDYNPERIMVDDVTLDEAIVVMPGDRVRSLVGVLDYNFGNYKIQPTSFDIKKHDTPNLPASTRSGPNGNTVITTFNVENLFDLELNLPVVVDALGQVGSSSYWGADNTLVRKPDVCSGRTDLEQIFDPSIEWDSEGDENWDDLGSHTSTCGQTSGLIVSEYTEGSSYNKAIEIYNGTGEAVNLGAKNVKVSIYFNGSTTAGQNLSLVGTVAPGDVFVLAHPSADPAILDVADQIDDGVLWNGNDAVVLNQGGKDDASSTPTPEDLQVQLTKLAMAIELELDLPEVIVVQEIENQAIAQVLADRVNAAAGTAYVATSFETSDGRGIEPGFLWDANRVSLIEAYQLNDDIVTGVSAAFGPESASPGREPIVGVFNIQGHEVIIVGNHFKSKGGDTPIFGMIQPFERSTEEQRKLQAHVVRDFINLVFVEDPDAMVMVAGDLNDFAFAEYDEGLSPIQIIEGIAGEVPMYNIIAEEKDAERFSYVYDGNSQVLDHMLVSPTLLGSLVGADMLHFNASYPAAFVNDPTTPLHSSDHDPVEGRFKIRKNK